MKRGFRYAVIAAVFMMGALAFLLYALNNPQASFPWGNSVTYAIYILYGLLTGAMCWMVYRAGRRR